jgi:DNA-binding response OmpR family regulator
VDVYILRLRQKIEMDPTNPTFIRAVRGFGYSFNENTVDSPAKTSAVG